MPISAPVIHSKLPDVGTTIFSVMSKLAQEHGAINLSQGFPDFPIDSELANQVSAAMAAGHNQYAPMPGLPALRQALAAKLQASGSPVDAETQITITAGATQALFTAFAALLQPGDEAIVFDPSYDSYVPSIQVQGARAIRIPLRAPEFVIDWQRVAAAVTPHTRMIVINNPGNPSTAVLSADDLTELANLAEQHNLLVLSDEVYEHLVYDEARHHSVLADPRLAPRSLAVFSFGKTFHATGWKIGYCAGAAALMSEFRKVHQYLVFSVNTPAQYALATYLADASHYTSLSAFYQAKRDILRQGLANGPLRLLPCRGTYFQLVDYSALPSHLSELDDADFAIWLTREAGVAAIPLSPFYAERCGHKLIRLCFAKQTATLQAATARLASL